MIKVEIKQEYLEEEFNCPSTATSDNRIERCGNCVACFRVTNCGKCPNCEQGIQPCVKRICIRDGVNAESYVCNNPLSSTIIISNDDPDIFADLLSENVEEIVPTKRKPYTKRVKDPNVKRSKPAVFAGESDYNFDVQLGDEMHENDVDGESKINRKPHKVHKPHVWQPREVRAMKRTEEEEVFHRQCYGPTCVKIARKDSKYCSDDCGYKLAEHRLKYILQNRVSDYYKVPPMSEKNDDKEILMLNFKKASAERQLKVANVFATTLDTYLFKLVNLREDKLDSRESWQKLEAPMFCLLCNQDIPMSRYQAHINLCEAKFQRKFDYCSKYELSKNPHDLICNKYILSSQGYCRRLRYACIEHYEDELSRNKKPTLCGYPLKLANEGSERIEDLFALDLGELVSCGICNAPRNACELHLNWETNVYAILDNHRMNLLLCLDEIAIEYHRVQKAYRTRGDALTLLVNWRQQSVDTAQKEELDYRAFHMAPIANSNDYLVLKEE